jgi:hypothetical protein
VVIANGRTRIVPNFIIADGRIIGIDAIADREQLHELDVTILDR